LAFSITKPCTSFKCLVNICNSTIVHFTLPFWFVFIPFLVLMSNIKWTRGC
jgi:hypothetical protein